MSRSATRCRSPVGPHGWSAMWTGDRSARSVRGPGAAIGAGPTRPGAATAPAHQQARCSGAGEITGEADRSTDRTQPAGERRPGSARSHDRRRPAAEARPENTTHACPPSRAVGPAAAGLAVPASIRGRGRDSAGLTSSGSLDGLLQQGTARRRSDPPPRDPPSTDNRRRWRRPQREAAGSPPIESRPPPADGARTAGRGGAVPSSTSEIDAGKREPLGNSSVAERHWWSTLTEAQGGFKRRSEVPG